MRNPSTPGSAALLAAALSVLVFTASSQPATAQSLLESIFGFLGTEQKPTPSRSDAAKNPFADGQLRPYGPTSYGGRYRTVCVRLCDGYFFPISNTSSRRDFYDDAQQCRSRCQSDTRLYYMSPIAPAIEKARDQRGLSYRDLKTAFIYRKKLVKNCTCRPAPWTAAERQRHKNYEIEDPEVIASLDSKQANEPPDAESPMAGRPLTPDSALNAAPVAIAGAYPARATPGYLKQHQRPLAQLNKPRKQKSADHGSSFISGLPKVRYRHNWSTE